MKLYLLLLCSALSFGQTQIKGNLHPITKENYSFLDKILKDKQIVLLGEQSHGDGATFDEKVLLIKYLHEKLGFNSIAFEGGLYDNYKAHQLLLNKKENSSIYNEAIFSIWSDTQSFQDLLAYIDERAVLNDVIKITGFDCQEGVLFEKYFITDLKAIFNSRKIKLSPLQTEQIEKTFVYKDLQKIATNKTDSIAFDKDVTYVLEVFEKMQNLSLHEKMIKQVFKSSLANINFEIAQIQKQKIAVQNPRDEQMANNLIFLTESYPNEKIVGWAASYHFAKKIANLEIDTLTETYFDKQADLEKEATGYTDYISGEGKKMLEGSIPMGEILSDYFKEKLYSIAFSSYEGEYGILNSNTYKILTPPETSIEKQLSTYNKAIFEFDKSQSELYCSALGNMPIKGNWAQSFDALVFIKISYQPVMRKFDESDFKKSKLSRFMVKGRVVDKKTNLIIPNAEIVYGVNEKLTVTKEDGTFELLVPNISKIKYLKVNAFGYASDSLQVKLETKNYEFKLNKSKLGGIVLDEVVLNSNQKELSAKQIVKKAEKNIKDNYYQKEYNQTFQYKQSVIQNDNDRVVDEAIIKFYNPKGLNSSSNKIYGRVEKLKKTPNKGDKFLFSSSVSLYSLWYRELITKKANALYRSGSYEYKKESIKNLNGKKAYKIYFENTSPGSFSTGFGYPAPKSSKGYLYIDCETFAVLKFEHCVERESFDLTNGSNQTHTYTYKIIATYQYIDGVCFMDELVDISKNTRTSKKNPDYLSVYYLVTSLKSDAVEVQNIEVLKEPVKSNFGATTPFRDEKAFWETRESIDNLNKVKEEFLCE